MCSPNSQPCKLQSSEDCAVWHWCAEQAVRWRHPVLRASGHLWDKPSQQSPLRVCMVRALTHGHAQGLVQNKEAWTEVIAALILYKTAQNTWRRDRKQEPDTFVSTIRLHLSWKKSLFLACSLWHCSSTHPGQLLCSVQSWSLSSDLLQSLKMQAVHWVRGCRASQFFFH